MRNNCMKFTISMLVSSLLYGSCNINNENYDRRYYVDESGDTIARKIDWDIIVTKYKYTSKDKELLDKIVKHMELSSKTKFYTQGIYEYLCVISDMECEDYPYKSKSDFWRYYDDYLLNFCYCIYDDLLLKDNDYHFVEEENRGLFYIDDVRIRNCDKTLFGFYGKDKIVYWTDKELNKDQIELVINSDKPFSVTNEAEFILLNKEGKPIGKYASVLFYRNGDHYNFTHFHSKNEYKYSFDPQKIKSRYVAPGMTIDECRKAWGDTYRKDYDRISGAEYWYYAKGKYLMFVKGKLVDFSDNENYVEE